MTYIKNIYNEVVDLTTITTKKAVGQKLADISKPIINNIIEQIKKNTFNFDDYSFEKNNSSGLTGKCGIYLIINKPKQKIYLGSSHNLAQRKGDHKRNFTNPKRIDKVYKSMVNDLLFGSPSDFYFIPILTFAKSNIIGLQGTAVDHSQQIKRFLDSFVEKLLLEFYLVSEHASAHYKEIFYNEKTTGEFQQGNKYGGAPGSGLPSASICFENYAWESVSAAAKTFNYTNKTIRNKRDQNIFKSLTKQEFELFEGIKIMNTEANSFFLDKQEELERLKLRIFNRKSLSA